MKSNKSFLPNLNALRFFAAAGILIAHVDQCLYMNGLKLSMYDFFPFQFGLQSVVLFFVLSGFLITYLLLKEKEAGEISIRKFYVSRMLRIWPLYFFLLIITFAYFNKSPYFFWNNLYDSNSFNKHPAIYSLLLVFLSPNIVGIFAGYFGYAHVSWSIGVEEQFYLIWPHIMKKKNYVIHIVLIILIMYVLSHGFIYVIAERMKSIFPNYLYFKLFDLSLFFTSWRSFKIDAMAIGALGAYLAVNKSGYLNIIYSKPVQVVTYLLLALLFISPNKVDYQFYSILFIIIILNLSLNKRSVLNFKSSVLDYFGKISYGIYMYHSITIVPSIALVHTFLNLKINFVTEMLIAFITMIFTIAAAFISYRFFESYFIGLKNKF